MGLSWPEEYGGRGLPPVFEAIFNDEVGESGYPMVSVSFLGRALMGYGTEAQRQQHLGPLLRGEIQWCQGFSEPQAGSDLAGLRTRAVQDGDHWVVNGQKMWTSGAPFSDWCLLLARTDPDVPKHKGISCFLTPMDAPGIEARPIVLADGEPETGEVFFDDVVIPGDQMLGARGDGWRLAMTTVSFERGAADVGMMANFLRGLESVERRVVAMGLQGDADVRRALARCRVRGEALRLNGIEALSRRSHGKPPGAESSVGKLLWSEAEQTLRQLELRLAGASVFNGDDPEVLAAYFKSRPVSVYGGSSQIQKNVLSRQILRLPR
jgi:alkylation response protein AidB-like acyl-CoA dehydrogenase